MRKYSLNYAVKLSVKCTIDVQNRHYSSAIVAPFRCKTASIHNDLEYAVCNSEYATHDSVYATEKTMRGTEKMVYATYKIVRGVYLEIFYSRLTLYST